MPFKKGDPRINRKGRPKKSKKLQDTLAKMAGDDIDKALRILRAFAFKDPSEMEKLGLSDKDITTSQQLQAVKIFLDKIEKAQEKVQKSNDSVGDKIDETTGRVGRKTRQSEAVISDSPIVDFKRKKQQ